MGDTYPVEVGAKGRVVLPAPLRRALGIEEGTSLVAVLEEGALVLMTREVAERRLRLLFAGIEESLADELIAERRAEAARESKS